MNKRIIIFLVYVLTFIPIFSSAKENYLEQIKVDNLRVNKSNGSVHVNMTIVLDDLKINSNDQIILHPYFADMTSGEVIEQLPPFRVYGRRRGIVIKRMNGMGLDGSDIYVSQIERKNGTAQSIDYKYSFPLESWIYNANLLFAENVYACAGCMVKEEKKNISEKPLIEKPYIPNYLLSSIIPEVEPVKARAERHTACINFLLDKSDILRNYKNNNAELDSVDKVISAVANNKDLTITHFEIVGYTSPEAPVSYNKSLAARRADALANYIVKTHGVSRNQFTVNGFGEDWNTLKANLSPLMKFRNEVIDIIENTPNPDDRDSKIVALDSGETYKLLLNSYYPALRRTEYSIAYNVRAFNIEEAKVLLKKNPKLLSLNEMYLVAKTYPFASKEYDEVYDIAAAAYPNEPTAVINVTSAFIRNKEYKKAIQLLSKLKNNADALNNLGIAYAYLGEDSAARDCFEKAAKLGCEKASRNLNELLKMLKTR